MIKINDVVEVLPNLVYVTLVGRKGFIVQKIDKSTSLVNFPCVCKHYDTDTKETVSSTQWYLQDKYLKIIDSPEDNRIGTLEENIQSLEDDLVITRAALSISEELRDKQFNIIEDLKKEIDCLNGKILRTRVNNDWNNFE